jgi:predicted ester cyclase
MTMLNGQHIHSISQIANVHAYRVLPRLRSFREALVKDRIHVPDLAIYNIAAIIVE